MLLKFQETKEIVEKKEETQSNNYWNAYIATQPEVLFWLCECFHYDIAHKNAIEHCRLIFCNCNKFIPKEFSIKIEITRLDVFYFENPNLVYDSLEFWVEYEKWSLKNVS